MGGGALNVKSKKTRGHTGGILLQSSLEKGDMSIQWKFIILGNFCALNVIVQHRDPQIALSLASHLVFTAVAVAKLT